MRSVEQHQRRDRDQLQRRRRQLRRERQVIAQPRRQQRSAHLQESGEDGEAEPFEGCAAVAAEMRTGGEHRQEQRHRDGEGLAHRRPQDGAALERRPAICAVMTALVPGASGVCARPTIVNAPA